MPERKTRLLRRVRVIAPAVVSPRIPTTLGSLRAAALTLHFGDGLIPVRPAAMFHAAGRGRPLFFVLACALLLTACRSHCPVIGPVGSEKPQPVNPITSAYQSANPPSAITMPEMELLDANRNRRSAELKFFSPWLGGPVLCRLQYERRTSVTK